MPPRANASNAKPPHKVEIRSSRIKIGFFILFFAWPYLILIPGLEDPHGRVGTIIMIGLCSVFVLLFTFLFIAPYKLTLDERGFTLSGGLGKPSSKILWEDVDRFCVDSGGRGSKVIGYRFVSGREPPAKFPWLRGKGSLPSCWPGSTEEMVYKLNAYRRRLMRKEGFEGSSPFGG